jgi:hypothetical protein
MSRPATFVVTLEAMPGGDGIRGLRRLLKTALRRDRLRAIDVREHAATKVSHCSTARAVRTTQGRRESEAKMKMSKYAGSSFINYDDVEGGPFRGTIAGVAHGSYDKAVVTFSSGQRFSLNVTNTQILIKAWGDESEDWIGEKAELYAGTVKFKGEETPSVLVRPLERKPGEKKVKPPKPATAGPAAIGMDDDIPY